MTTPDNTLLGRCTAALDEAIRTIDYPPHTMRARRAGAASMLDHLAAEIAVMLERAPNLTPHQLITILRIEAAGELAGWENDKRTVMHLVTAKLERRLAYWRQQQEQEILKRYRAVTSI